MIVVTIRQRAVASILCISKEATAKVSAGPMTQRPVEVMKLPDRFRRARQHSGDDQKCDAELAFHLSFPPAGYNGRFGLDLGGASQIPSFGKLASRFCIAATRLHADRRAIFRKC